MGSSIQACLIDRKFRKTLAQPPPEGDQTHWRESDRFWLFVRPIAQYHYRVWRWPSKCQPPGSNSIGRSPSLQFVCMKTCSSILSFLSGNGRMAWPRGYPISILDQLCMANSPIFFPNLIVIEVFQIYILLHDATTGCRQNMIDRCWGGCNQWSQVKTTLSLFRPLLLPSALRCSG